MAAKNFRRFRYSIVFVLFTMFLIILSSRVTGAENGAKKERKKISKDLLREVVAKINGEEILFRDLIVELEKVLPRRFHGKTLKKQGKRYQMRALWNLIWRELLYQEGKRLNISVEDKVSKDVEKIKKRLKKRKSLERLLKKVALSKEEWRRDIEIKYMENAVQQKMFKVFRKEFEQEITESDLKSYYEKNKENYIKPASLKLREIFLKIDPGGGDENWNKIKAQAEDLKRRSKEGEDFAELAKKYSQDDYANDGGDVGWVHTKGIAPEITNVAVHFDKGEIGGPVWTLYGYYIFKIEDKIPAAQLSYSEVKEQVKQALIDKKLDIRKREWIEGLRKKAKIEIFEPPIELFPSNKEQYLIPQLEVEEGEKQETRGKKQEE